MLAGGPSQIFKMRHCCDFCQVYDVFGGVLAVSTHEVSRHDLFPSVTEHPKVHLRLFDYDYSC